MRKLLNGKIFSCTIQFKDLKFLLTANCFYPMMACRELSHLDAGIALAGGDWIEAGRIWEEILTEHPRDMYAENLAFFGHIHTGRHRGLRDTPARIVKEFKAGDRYYG